MEDWRGPERTRGVEDYRTGGAEPKKVGRRRKQHHPQEERRKAAPPKKAEANQYTQRGRGQERRNHDTLKALAGDQRPILGGDRFQKEDGSGVAIDWVTSRSHFSRRKSSKASLKLDTKSRQTMMCKTLRTGWTSSSKTNT